MKQIAGWWKFAEYQSFIAWNPMLESIKYKAL